MIFNLVTQSSIPAPLETICTIAAPLETICTIDWPLVEVDLRVLHIIFDEAGQPIRDEDSSYLLEEYQ